MEKATLEKLVRLETPEPRGDVFGGGTGGRPVCLTLRPSVRPSVVRLVTLPPGPLYRAQVLSPELAPFSTLFSTKLKTVPLAVIQRQLTSQPPAFRQTSRIHSDERTSRLDGSRVRTEIWRMISLKIPPGARVRGTRSQLSHSSGSIHSPIHGFPRPLS